MTGLQLLAAGVAVTSLMAFGLFGFDKGRARGHGRRISERTLLLAAVAGAPGAWLARHLFRHKTRKQPFGAWLALATVTHLAGVAALGFLLAR